MSSSKHVRALKRVTLALVFCLPPVLYLAYQYSQKVVLDIEKFGVVPDFQMLFVNNPKGMTHIDTTRHLTVIAVLKNTCAEGCPEVVAQMKQIKDYFETELQGKDSDPNTPSKARFIVQAEQGLNHLPDDWDKADMSLGTVYLVPEVKKEGPFPALVLIDDAGYFRGFLPFADSDLVRTVQVELTRIVSNQYLYHYVTRQTLMWRKANGRAESEEKPEAH